MRHGASSSRRQRNRGGNNNNRRGSNNRSQVFDSNGPDVRIRGTAHQIHEKYMALAKDACGSGDRIVEQSYLQHAEHYQRIISSWAEADEDRRASASTDDNQQEANAQHRSRTRNQQQDGEDLGLPSSIVGADSRKETELEDA